MPRKRALTFQTPKKKAATPLRVTKKIANKPVASPFKEPVPAEDLENKLISAYREENAFLRNLKRDALLYNNLLGITIDENGSILSFKIARTSTTGPKELRFSLEECGESYVFRLEESINCSIPEYFNDVLEFDKQAFPLFFYKAMQAVYEVRSNVLAEQ